MPAVDLEMERTALLTALEEFERAENNKDVPAMLTYIAEDCVFVHRDRMLAGKQAIGEMLKRPPKTTCLRNTSPCAQKFLRPQTPPGCWLMN